MFPKTENEFRVLSEQGKDVEYAETEGKDTPPEGDDWAYWSDRVTEQETVAVWRRIVRVHQAME